MVLATSVLAPSADCLKDGLDQVSPYELYLCHTSVKAQFRSVCLDSVALSAAPSVYTLLLEDHQKLNLVNLVQMCQ